MHIEDRNSKKFAKNARQLHNRESNKGTSRRSLIRSPVNLTKLRKDHAWNTGDENK